MAPKKEEKSLEEALVDPHAGEGKAYEEEYKKELTEEQLQAFYEHSETSEEDAVNFMALEVLGFPGFTYAGKMAILLDYFVSVLMFAKEEGLGPPQTLIMFKMSHDILDLIKVGATLRKSESVFKVQILRCSMKVPGTNHIPLLTTINLQKIVPYFMNSVFQHYNLFQACFLRNPLQWYYSEEVWIETAFTLPLVEADTQQEIGEDKATKEAYERALAEYEAARLAAEVKALWDLEHPPIPKRPPNNLDEAIDFSVRDKVDELKIILEEEYKENGSTLLERCKKLEAIIAKLEQDEAYIQGIKQILPALFLL